MDKPSDNQLNPASQTGLSAARAIRRRIVVGGGGVLLAVQARTSLGQAICQSPSVMLSGNASPQAGAPAPCSGGLSPGFWRNPQHFSAWVGAEPATLINVSPCPTGLGGIGPENIGDQGTLVKPVFGWAAVKMLTSYTYVDGGGTSITIWPEDWGLWAVLAFPKLVGIQEGHLLWHLTAAYLNSLAFPDYALTTTQVIQAAEALLDGGLWCPTIDCGANAFTPQDFVDYVSGMYDINADLEFQLCKAP